MTNFIAAGSHGVCVILQSLTTPDILAIPPAHLLFRFAADSDDSTLIELKRTEQACGVCCQLKVSTNIGNLSLKERIHISIAQELLTYFEKMLLIITISSNELIIVVLPGFTRNRKQ